jgi:hypothetical protein
MNNTDVREQLVNEQLTGTATQIQIPAQCVTLLHGILFDLDPMLYRAGNALFPPDQDPRRFFENIRPILDRHPLARSAEVRVSGTGLHVIVRLSPALVLSTAAEQAYWESIVRAVQATLPADVNMPGITALTRPVGALNSKNNAIVELIRAATPITAEQVVAYLNRVTEAPFCEIMTPLLGGSRIEPCPVCQGEGTRLDVLDRAGICYGGCGKVKLEDIYDSIYPPAPQKNADTTDEAESQPSPTKAPASSNMKKAAGPSKARKRRTD